MRTATFALLLSAFAFASPVFATGPFSVGGERIGAAVIVAAEGQEATARTFAGQVRRITGQALRVVAEGEAPAEEGLFRVHVGNTAYVDGLGLDFEGLHPYGYYLMLPDRDNLVMAGQPWAKARHSGTEYAAYDFLKRFAGYRPLMPSRPGYRELAASAPLGVPIEIPADLELREEPSFVTWANAQLWHGPGGYFRSWRTTLLATHHLASIYPPEKYGETNPEYYPMIRGERSVPPVGRKGTWQPCVSNPDLPPIAVEYAREYFESRPQALGMSVGVNDGRGDCHCPECVAWDEQYGNRYVPFVNAVARLFQEEYPDKLVNFIAYGHAINPPRNIQLEPNVYVEIIHGLRDDMGAIREWRDAGAQNVGVYHHLLGGRYVIPRYFPRVLGEAWKTAYRELGLKGGWMESSIRVWLYDGPLQHVLNELAWDIEADIEEILRDYFAHCYGPAAVPMQQLFDRFEEVHLRSPDPLAIHVYGNRPDQLAHFEQGDLDFFDARLAEAREAVAKDEAAAGRLALFEEIFGLSRLFIASHVALNELRAVDAAAGRAQADAAVAATERGLRYVRETDEYAMDESVERAVFARNYTLESYRTRPTLRIGPPIEVECDRVFALITERLMAEGGWPAARAYWMEKATQADEMALRPLALTQVYLREAEAAGVDTVVLDADFEPAEGEPPEGADEAEAEGLAWAAPAEEFADVPGRPRGWSTTVFPRSVTRFYWDPSQARTGTHSLAIRQNQVRGSFLTVVPVTPGIRYRLTAWVRQNPPGRGGRMTIRWRGEGGWVDQGEGAVPRISAPYPTSDEPEWLPVDITFTAPERASSAMLLFGAPRQSQDEATWIDDVKMVKVYDPAFFED